MRPDVEEYEDVEDDKPASSSRAMSWVVLAVAVGGFAALAYYAYHSGTRPVAGDDIAVIEADPSPIKSAPESPDGEQFANKDKTIYDVIAPDGGKMVEKLMPEPERPITATNVEDSEDSAPVAAAPQAAVAAVANAKPAAPTTFVAPKQAEKVARAEVVPVPASPAPRTTVAEAAPAGKPYEAPVMINEKKPAAVKEEVKPKAEKQEAKPKTVVKAETPDDEQSDDEPEAKPASSGGAYKLQLGAYQSEAEAKAAWAKISKKYASVLSDAPSIIRAELPKGTYYRLRTGSYASSADAKAACAKLGSQACMVVK